MSEGVKSECFINGKCYKCRTCFDPGQSLYSLNDECNKTKTWRDLLKEVAQLQTTEDELLPNTMCSKCLDKLITFYDFILQIDNVNKKYMELLGNISDPLAVGYLNKKEIFSNRSTIDKPLEDEFISEIKMEKEEADEYISCNNDKVDTFDVNIPTTAMELIWSPTVESNQNLNNDDSNESSSSFEETDWLPRKKSRKVMYGHMSEFYDKIKKVDNRFVCPKCKKKFSTSSTCRRHLDKMHTKDSSEDSSSSSSDECDDVPSSAITSQTKDDSVFDKIEKINDRFVCPICKKTFTLHRNCRRHIQYLHLKEENTFYCGFCELTFTIRDYLNAHLKRMHPGETLESNSKKLERLFGERLYSKPTTWQCVECKLCSITFTTTKELHHHLENHFNLLYNMELNNEIVQNLFANINDVNTIKEIIVKDISEKNFFKYYRVLNEYGYEMSVSDTEAEDLLEDTAERSGKYKCELCSETFSFKYKVFNHLKEDHPKEESPLKCKRCKIEFVSIDMHEKHLQTHCENQDKIVYCNNCPGRFVWQESMKNHNCPLHTSKGQQKSNEPEVLEISKPKEQIEKKEISNCFKTPLKNSDQNKSSKLIHETIIRCALCEDKFKKLQHLQQHMSLHADGITGINFKESIYVKVFRSAELIDYPLWQQQIKEAYSKSQISQFYLAFDEYGNELDISDSDNEDDSDATENIKNEYICDICKEIFHKRKLLLNHQKERHNNEALPFTCKNCNQQYVNFNLLQQHLKKVCWNIHRQNAKQCEYCNESFIWPDNLIKHKEIQHSKLSEHINETHRNITASTSTAKTVPADKFFPNDESSILAEIPPASPSPSIHFYCLMCPKTFYTIENLNEHLERHRLSPSDIKTVESIVHSTWWPNGEKKIICKVCNLTFKTMANIKEHYSTTNLKNSCANQHSLANYSITNQKGFELHLELDSETEIEDENNATNTKTLFPYKCCMCNKSFKRKYQVAQHQRSMHNYEFLELKCERCIFRTVSQKVLDYHKETQCFNEDKKLKCDLCNLKFMWQENLDNHKTILHTPKDLNATLNDLNASDQIAKTDNKNFAIIAEQLKSTGYEESVDVSKMSKKSEKPTTSKSSKYVCHICGSNFTNNNNLKVHIMRHNKTNLPFKCDFCEMTFPRNADLQEHRRTHTGERPFKCTLCDKSFSRKNKLTMHTRLHTGELPYHCTLCKKSFNRAEHLKLHLLGHKGDKPYKCNICGKGFICDSYLNRHRKDVGHNELWSTPENNITNKDEGEQKSQNSKKQSLCPICGIYLSRNTSVTAHMRTHTGEKPHKCDFCEMSFVRKCDLTDHRRVHTAERPFQCTYCEKAFPRRCQLTVHVRIHTGERPYKCTYCNKAFIRSESLKLHVRIHTGEKPFSCEVCDLAFSCARYLKKHRIAKGHHEEKEENCGN